MAPKQQTVFWAVPKPNAARDKSSDTAITIISHKPRTTSDWETLVKATGDDSLRARIWKATGAMEISIPHSQPLDWTKTDSTNAASAASSSPSSTTSPPPGPHVLEMLAHTGHSFINMEDCRRFRQHEVIQAWEASNDADLIFQPATLYYSHKTGEAVRSSNVASVSPSSSSPSSAKTSTTTPTKQPSSSTAQPPAPSQQPTGLAVFDMDSTLIQQEVIDELARSVGRYEAVSAITEAAMRGEAPYTDFTASLQARVKLLQGVPSSIWEDLKRERISFTPGAAELIAFLKARGWKTAVLSGGFTPLAEWVRETLGLDYAFANFLAVDEAKGELTGELVPGKAIVHGERKRELLLELAEKDGVDLSRTLAVGDGSNDLLMMHTAGLGIAFNAKPKVQFAAPAKLNSPSLVDVLYVLGFTKSEIAASL